MVRTFRCLTEPLSLNFAGQLAILFLLAVSFYSDAGSYDEGKNYAKSKAGIASPTDANLPASMYKGQNVPEKNLMNADLESEARLKIVTDPDAAEIYNMEAKRPRLHFDAENDPRFKQLRENRDKAYAVVDGGYQGCETLKTTPLKVGEEIKKCDVRGYRDSTNFSCYYDVNVSCSNSDVNEIRPVTASSISISDDITMEDLGNGRFLFKNKSYRRHACGYPDWYSDWIRVWLPQGWTFSHGWYEVPVVDDWLFMYADGQRNPDASAYWTHAVIGRTWDHDKTGRWNCEQHKRYHRGKQLDLIGNAFVRNPRYQVFNLYHSVGGGGLYEAILEIHMKRDCDIKEEGEHSCDDGFINQGDNVELVNNWFCSDRNPTRREIGNTGHYFSRDCWGYQSDYKEWSTPYFIEDGACDELRKQGCQQENTGICEDENPAGYCNFAKIDFSCGIYESSGEVDLCGSIMPCKDGDCAEGMIEPYDATDDFLNAATMMAAADAMIDEFDPDNLHVFKGRATSCDDKPVDFSDCCSASGWGQDLDLVSCEAHEKDLLKAMRGGRAKYIDKKEKGSWPLEYFRERWCEFPSKIGYLIVKGAYEQLGIGWGNYNNPNCDGITLEQFQQIDFSQIDLSDYFNDVMDKAQKSMNLNMPSSEVAAQRLQQQAERMQASGSTQ